MLTTEPKPKKVPAFIFKLWNIMHQPQYAHLICWTEGEESILVLNEQGFADVVLAAHFKNCKFSSFTRQLNIYNFTKTKFGDTFKYSHLLFRKNRKDLLKGIKRKPTQEEIQLAQQLNMDNKQEPISEEQSKPEKTQLPGFKPVHLQFETPRNFDYAQGQEYQLMMWNNFLMTRQQSDICLAKVYNYYYANIDNPLLNKAFSCLIQSLQSEYIEQDISKYRITCQTSNSESPEEGTGSNEPIYGRFKKEECEIKIQ